MKTFFFVSLYIIFLFTSINSYAKATIDFSHERGLYTKSFDLEISITGDNLTTRFTLDGSEPTESSGILLNNSNLLKIPGISSSTVVRVYSFNTNESVSATNTYIFKNDVFSQNNNTVISEFAYPSQWGYGTSFFGYVNCRRQAANYEMSIDDCFTGTTNLEQKLYDGLMQIPTIAISLDKYQIFGPDSGLYVFPIENSDTCYTLPNNVNSWERKASVEIFNDTKNKDASSMQINAGLKISGQSSRYLDFYKHSFQLMFREEYGTPKLNYPLFGDEATGNFKSLELRMIENSSPHDWTDSRREETQLHKDSWARNLQKQMSGNATSPTSKFFHLFINGLYWGLYDVCEIPDANYMADYYGGEPSDYDVIKELEVKSGTDSVYNYMYDLGHSIYDTIQIDNFNQKVAVNENRASNFYGEISSLLDVDQFIDYSLLNLYFVNTDWGENNWWAARNAKENGKFQFFVWDAEFVLNFAGINETIYNTGNSGTKFKYHPIDLNQRLFDVPEYRNKFGDHIQCQCVEEDGLLNPKNLINSYKAAESGIDNASMLEFARWANVRKNDSDYDPICFDVIEKTIEKYEAEKFPILINAIMNAYGNPDSYNLFPKYVQKIRRNGEYIYEEIFHFKAVEFSKFGGEVESGYQLTLSNPNNIGDIYYTTNGSDPRNVDGTISASAIKYEEPITINKQTEVKARVFTETFTYRDPGPKTINNMWSAMCPRKFYMPGETPQEEIVSTEIYRDENISIFPTLVKNQISIAGLPAQKNNNVLSVFSVNGQKLIEKNTTGFTETLNTEVLPKGHYILTVSKNNEIIFSDKIIKMD